MLHRMIFFFITFLPFFTYHYVVVCFSYKKKNKINKEMNMAFDFFFFFCAAEKKSSFDENRTRKINRGIYTNKCEKRIDKTRPFSDPLCFLPFFFSLSIFPVTNSVS